MAPWETVANVSPFPPALLTTPTPSSQDTIPSVPLLILAQDITETAPTQEPPCGLSNPPIDMAQTALSKALSMVSHTTGVVLCTSGGRALNG
jgi:hypothetical protein